MGLTVPPAHLLQLVVSELLSPQQIARPTS